MSKLFTRFWKLNNARFTAALVSMALLCNVAFAQDQQISGKVLDEAGAGLPGASVLIKGTSTGTVTDMDGNFSISAASSDVLVVSFIGYQTKEVTVGGQTSIEVSLEIDAEQLEEVVVTGYTSQRKRDITSAVSVVDTEELNAIKAPSFASKLSGRAPGVTVSTGGAPGSGANIRIRGINSFNGSDPLIIIDGVQIQGDKALNGLNPNDIESMQILKDASAASIYGVRASNGVIVITTKQGKAGKLQVTYDGYVGTQAPVGGYNDILVKDPVAFGRYNAIKAGNADFYGGDASNPQIPEFFYGSDPSSYSYPDNLVMRSNAEGTDWWDEVFSPAPITEHNIGISGGNENATFSSSVGYINQQGTMMETFYERYSARLNSRFTYGKFKFGESVSIARSERNVQEGGTQNEQNVMTQILKLNSIVPVYDVAGNFAGAKTNGFSNGRNPVAFQFNNRHDIDEETRILANTYGEFELIDGLSVKSSFSVDYAQRFFPRSGHPRFEDREVNSTNNYSEDHQNNYNWVWTNTINYSKTFADKHTINVLAGYESVRQQYHRINARVDNLAFMDPDVRYLNLVYSTFNTVNSTESDITFVSQFGKIDYAFDDKYLLSFTIRRDGSSYFVDDKYGVFPAFSAGWRISSESFMDGVSWLDDLKLRFGWGIAGNPAASGAAYNGFDQWGGRSTFDASYDITGANGGAAAGFTRFRFGDPTATFEETETMNIGFDAALLDGRLGIVFDYYTKTTEGLWSDSPYPGTAGNSSAPFRNLAGMDNTGYDLGLTYKAEVNSDLSMNFGVNISGYKNEITALDGSSTQVFPVGIDKRFGEVNVWKVGESVPSFFGYIHDGIFKTQAEVDALDQPGAEIGRFRWKDLNGDGQITSDDQTVIGDPNPAMTLGINIGVDYKNFDFSTQMFGSFGNEIYNYNRLFTHFGFFNSNISNEVITNSWDPNTNPGGTLPMWNGNDNTSVSSSSFYVEDGSYFRMQTLTIGYTFPTGSILGMESLRLYAQAQNLFTITGYSGIDPALSSVNVGATIDGRRQNDGWQGFDFGNYPASRTFMFGINARF